MPSSHECVKNKLPDSRLVPRQKQPTARNSENPETLMGKATTGEETAQVLALIALVVLDKHIAY
jgi:hypothetical protein